MKKIYISNVRHLDVCNNKVFQNICNGYFFSWLIILFDRCVLVSDLIMTWANFLTTINTEEHRGLPSGSSSVKVQWPVYRVEVLCILFVVFFRRKPNIWLNWSRPHEWASLYLLGSRTAEAHSITYYGGKTVNSPCINIVLFNDNTYRYNNMQLF